MPEVTGKKRLGQERKLGKREGVIQHDGDRRGLGAGQALVVFRQFKGDLWLSVQGCSP